GAYPAIVLSGMRALQVMKSNFVPGTASIMVRRSLVVLQFSISVFLIIYTLIMLQQMRYMQNKDLGYKREQVISLPVDGRMREQYDLLKASLAQVPGVASVSGAYETPEYVLWGDGLTAIDEKGQHHVSVNAMPVDIGFTETMQMKLLAGRDFSRSDLFSDEQKRETGGSSNAYILNESLVRKLGWTPEEAIGKRVSKGIEGAVVGVVSDFHFRSLHNEVGPLVMFLDPDLVRQWVVRVDAGSISASIAGIEHWWKQRVSHRPFSFTFLDENYQRLYKAEERTSVLFISVSVLAILLACLGLFGLASFAVVQRTREIGIRRVLGAGSLNIVWVVAKGFLVLVGVGVCIAIPAAWILGRQWLNDHAYRVEPSVWNLVFAGVFALLVALVTIAVRSLNAAFNNPVNSLRTA
ncbi:MAG TPA: FtsX-like permease family protein, partial [Phnomibacter sp.]|nr:FtsX-like permease family protein [Phnomibacter sp.]